MIAISWYLLKVLICSGILCGYYFLALRNKAFHRWNRFYLLASVVISLLIPVIKLDIFQNEDSKGTVVQVLQTISYGDEAVIEYSKNNSFQLSSQNLAEGAYLLISMILLSIFLISLVKIIRLRRKYPETKIEDISFINTEARGTPFSFFKSIFWNKAIDLHTKAGQQIFNHELAHIQEKHSYDKIFINLVMILFWINPFFWLMRKELYMIHEFIADKEALEDNDLNAFAEMVLQTVYPGQNFSFTNNFFYSPLKRRILMLTKNKNPKVSYLSRLLVLPLAAIIFFAFTLKVKNNDANLYNGNPITVVIDAGHGGKNTGAVVGKIEEKDIALAIAKKVKELNTNKKINIVLTRDNDESIPIKDRAIFANAKKADLFISIHLDAIMKKGNYSGFSVLIPDNENPYMNQSKLLGSSIINSFKSNYPLPVANELIQRQVGIWVLKAVECPAVLIEAGYLTTPKDLEYLLQSKNQETIAKNILNGIENYEYSLKNETNVTDNIRSDTIPPMYYQNKKVTGLQVLSKSDKVKITAPVIKVTYDNGTTEMISKEESDKRGFVLPPPPPSGLPPHYFKTNMLFVVDGKITPKEKVKNMDPRSMGPIYFLKKDESIKKYGDKGKYGAIEINLKNDGGETTTIKADSIYFNSKLVRNQLIFINGKEATEEDLQRTSPGNIESITILKSTSGELLYGDKGKNGVVKITTKEGRGNVTLVSTDAKYIYGNSLNEKNDTLPGKVFIKVENEASFPGGPAAWQKYIVRAIQASLDSFTNADFGTCVLRFIVNTDGTVSDVQATTMKGTLLAKVAVNAIRTGPKWIPASQNGKVVAAYRLQPVTLTNPESKEKTSNGKVLTKVQVEASFPGGPVAWQKYIVRAIRASLDSFTNADFGTCVLKFIVNKDGSISDVEATTMKGTKLAEVSVNAIKKGPKWIPASQNGKIVAAYRLQPVTLSNPNEPGTKTDANKSSTTFNANDDKMIFVKLEKPASFPGGHASWLKYISRVFEKNGNELMADKNNLGTCKVKFIVNQDGTVSDVQAITKQGTQLAELAINTIRKGPKWNPGMQNGHLANSYVIQPVTFELNDKIMGNEPE